jgi:hypothetical protein
MSSRRRREVSAHSQTRAVKALTSHLPTSHRRYRTSTLGRRGLAVLATVPQQRRPKLLNRI